MIPLRCRSTRYGVAIVAVTAAILVRWLLTPYVDGRLPFGCLMVAVVVASGAGGFGPGMVTLVLGCLATMWLFLEPVGSFRVEEVPMQITLAAYVIVGVLTAVLGEAFRRSRERARAYSEWLGDEFQETGEVCVCNPSEIRFLRTVPASRAPINLERDPEIGLAEIITDVVPGLTETFYADNWHINLSANGKPVANIEIKKRLDCELGALRNWVITNIKPT